MTWFLSLTLVISDILCFGALVFLCFGVSMLWFFMLCELTLLTSISFFFVRV
ncbi:hypothetical protein EDC96DRAFT_535816, partial [Choanephora cucurbitarum]